jgi:hypothetical protein
MMRGQFPDLASLPALERKKRRTRKAKKKPAEVKSTRLDSETRK